WNDGKRHIYRYDPAIPDYKTMPGVTPETKFDLVMCFDVLEHIAMMDLPRVLNEVVSRSKNAIFTISMKPARAKLPDGRNAHVTLLTKTEWMRWIEDVFGKAVEIPTPWEHELLVRTF